MGKRIWGEGDRTLSPLSLSPCTALAFSSFSYYTPSSSSITHFPTHFFPHLTGYFPRPWPSSIIVQQIDRIGLSGVPSPLSFAPSSSLPHSRVLHPFSLSTSIWERFDNEVRGSPTLPVVFLSEARRGWAHFVFVFPLVLTPRLIGFCIRIRRQDWEIEDLERKWRENDSLLLSLPSSYHTIEHCRLFSPGKDRVKWENERKWDSRRIFTPSRR